MSATSRRGGHQHPHTWACECGCANGSWRTTCFVCAKPKPGTPPAVFKDEPEYEREARDDDRARRHETYEDHRLTYPEKGLASE